MEPTPTKKRFNWDNLLIEGLNFVQHARLMLLLLCVGCLLGVCYFVYATPLYFSSAMVKVDTFGLAVSNDTGSEMRLPGYLLNRRLVEYLRSERFTKQVAVAKGWADESLSAKAIRETLLPVVYYRWLDTQTLEVTVMSSRVPVVQEFAQSVVDIYQDYESERRSDYRKKSIAIYLTELEQLRGQLDSEMDRRFDFEKDSDLTNLFIRQRNLTQVPKELVLVQSRMEQLERGLEKLGSAIDSADVTEHLAVLTTLENEALGLSDIGDFTRKKEGESPLVDTIDKVADTEVFVQPVVVANWEAWERERRELVEQKKMKGATFLPDHPVMKDLDEQITALNQRLQSEYSVRLERLQSELADLARRKIDLQARMPDYEKVTREYEEFRRDYSLLTKSELAWDKMFEDMAKKIASLEFGADKQRMDISFAGFVNLRDENPVSPNKTKLAMISLALGVGLAFGVPFLLNLSNTTTAKIPDLEAASGLAGIGAVPLVDTEYLENIVRSPMLDAEVPNALLENFRLIRSNVCLHPNRSGASQVIMVTSARPGEGKSTQAANLAWAFFSMGQRTLLIDCDLRRGRQHDLTRVSNEAGMTHLLTGRAALNDVILPTGNQNLDVIPRGPIIAGSTEVLCQRFFDEVIAELRQRYDRIVLDTPPVLGLSETASLQRLTDGVVLIVRSETTPQRDSLDALDKLEKAGAHMFGFVLNGVDLNKMTNRYYHYYYSSNYYESMVENDSPGLGGEGNVIAESKGLNRPPMRIEGGDDDPARAVVRKPEV